MKKLIAIGILSAIATLTGIIVTENVFEEKSVETDQSVARIVQILQYSNQFLDEERDGEAI